VKVLNLAEGSQIGPGVVLSEKWAHYVTARVECMDGWHVQSKHEALCLVNAPLEFDSASLEMGTALA
jgi:hypothetical protein